MVAHPYQLMMPGILLLPGTTTDMNIGEKYMPSDFQTMVQHLIQILKSVHWYMM